MRASGLALAAAAEREQGGPPPEGAGACLHAVILVSTHPMDQWECRAACRLAACGDPHHAVAARSVWPAFWLIRGRLAAANPARTEMQQILHRASGMHGHSVVHLCPNALVLPGPGYTVVRQRCAAVGRSKGLESLHRAVLQLTKAKLFFTARRGRSDTQVGTFARMSSTAVAKPACMNLSGNLLPQQCWDGCYKLCRTTAMQRFQT